MVLSSLTIGIPVYNEEKTIKTSMLSILDAAKQISIPYELIVCFNGTTDKSKEVLNEIRSHSIKIIDSEKGKAKAIKALGEAAKSEIIVFTDADTIMYPDCLVNLLEPFNDSKILAVTGRPVPVIKPSFVYNVINARMLYPDSEIAKNHVDNNTNKPFLHGRLYAVRKKVFEEFGELKSMNLSIGDDTFLTHHILLKYGRQAIFCAKNAHTKYLPVQSIHSWWLKWSRIWEDLDKLYRNNHQFKSLSHAVKTKIDWKYVFSLPWKVRFAFIFERCLHHSARIYFLISKIFSNFEWIRLDDTKEAFT